MRVVASSAPQHAAGEAEPTSRTEIGDGLWFIDVCERNGNMDQAEADEWRRRIMARQGFLALPDDHSRAFWNLTIPAKSSPSPTVQ